MSDKKTVMPQHTVLIFQDGGASPHKNHAKDMEFTPARIGQRWAARYHDAQRAHGADEGVLLHDFTNIRSRTEAVSS